MTGIFIFPVKSDDKEYQFYKEPRKVLEIDDDKVMSLMTASRGIYYIMHYDKEWDSLSDAEVVEKWNERMKVNKIQLSSRKSGLGYSTIDKSNFVRIVRK